MKLLLDENLSPRLVKLAATIGVYAAHVAHRGLSGKSDPDVLQYALAHDFVLATINASDFLALAAGVDLHPGVIVLRVSSLTPDEQWAHLEPALLDCLAQPDDAADMINHIIEIRGIGRYRRYPLPAT